MRPGRAPPERQERGARNLRAVPPGRVRLAHPAHRAPREDGQEGVQPTGEVLHRRAPPRAHGAGRENPPNQRRGSHLLEERRLHRVHRPHERHGARLRRHPAGRVRRGSGAHGHPVRRDSLHPVRLLHWRAPDHLYGYPAQRAQRWHRVRARPQVHPGGRHAAHVLGVLGDAEAAAQGLHVRRHPGRDIRVKPVDGLRPRRGVHRVRVRGREGQHLGIRTRAPGLVERGGGREPSHPREGVGLVGHRGHRRRLRPQDGVRPQVLPRRPLMDPRWVQVGRQGPLRRGGRGRWYDGRRREGARGRALREAAEGVRGRGRRDRRRRRALRAPVRPQGPARLRRAHKAAGRHLGGIAAPRHAQGRQVQPHLAARARRLGYGSDEKHDAAPIEACALALWACKTSRRNPKRKQRLQ